MDAPLYYARVVNNRILVGISAIGAQQVAATEQTVAAIDQLLDHVATYPDYEIIYRASDMILAAHSDTGLNNDSKARSRAGADIFLSEDEPTPKRNGAVLAIAQIMKLAMSLVAEVELGALYITAKETVPVRQTLIEMGWKQPQSPIQTDNSTLTGVVKKPSSNEKEKPWTCVSIGYGAANRKANFDFIGTQVTSIGETIAQITISQFTIQLTNHFSWICQYIQKIAKQQRKSLTFLWV